jgi:hypothetical protein
VFAISDLFLVGTALDLVGGALIAHGLLTSLDVLAGRAGTFWGGNPTVAVGAVEDRVDAQFGLITLGLGFTLQATGYFLGLDLEPSVTASAGRAVTGLALGALSAVAVLTAWRCTRDRLVARNLVELARWEITNLLVSPTLHDLPDLTSLASYGRAWDQGADGETDSAVVARLFGPISTRSPAPDSEGSEK